MTQLHHWKVYLHHIYCPKRTSFYEWDVFICIYLFIFNALNIRFLTEVFNLPFKEQKICKEFPSYSFWDKNAMEKNFNAEMTHLFKWNIQWFLKGLEVSIPVGELNMNPELHLPPLVIIFIKGVSWCDSLHKHCPLPLMLLLLMLFQSIQFR